jgi:hypothetical protein
VLTTTTVPRQLPLAAGYTVRPLEGADWDQAVAMAVADNERSGEHEPVSHELFVRRRVQTQQALSVFRKDASDICHCSPVVHNVAHDALGSTQQLLMKITLMRLKSRFPLHLVRSRSWR